MSSASLSVQAVSPLVLQEKRPHFLTTSHSSSSSYSPLTSFQWVQRKYPPRIRLKLAKSNSSSHGFPTAPLMGSSQTTLCSQIPRPNRIPSRIKLYNGLLPPPRRTECLLPISVSRSSSLGRESTSRNNRATMATPPSQVSCTPSPASSRISWNDHSIDSPFTKRKADSCPEPDIPKIKLKLRRVDTQETLLPHTNGSCAANLITVSANDDPCCSIKKPRKTQVPIKPCLENSFDPDRQQQYDQEDEILIRDDPHHTQKKAHHMIRWAVATNPRLVKEYDLRELLGWGGCGAVLGGYRRLDKIKVAIKIIYKKKSHHGSLPTEIDIVSSAEHACIVKYLDHFEDERVYYLVMEQFGTRWTSDHDEIRPCETLPALVIHPMKSQQDESPGPVFLIVSQASCASLFDFIDYYGGHLPRETIPIIFKAVASAIAHLHSQGIVHGDIKEENVLVGISSRDEKECLSRCGSDRNTLRQHPLLAKLCDFGHALRAKRNHKCMVRYGTRDLSAPELFNNLKQEEEGDVGCLTRYHGFEQDVWALGLLLYTMVHGELPCELSEYIKGDLECRKDGSLPIDYDPTAGKECIDLMKKMLAVDPSRRISMEGVVSHPYLRKSRKRSLL